MIEKKSKNLKRKIPWIEIGNQKIGDTEIDAEAEIDYRNIDFDDSDCRFENPSPTNETFFKSFDQKNYYAAGRKRFNMNRFSQKMFANEKSIEWIPFVRETIEILFETDLEFGFTYNELRKTRYGTRYQVPIAYSEKKSKGTKAQYSIVVRIIKFMLFLRQSENSNLPVEILLHDWFSVFYKNQFYLKWKKRELLELRYCAAPEIGLSNRQLQKFLNFVDEDKNYWNFDFPDMQKFYLQIAIMRSRPKLNIKWKLRKEIDDSRIEAGLMPINWAEYDEKIRLGVPTFVKNAPKWSILEE